MSVTTAIVKSLLVAGMASSACALAQQPVLFANLADAMNAGKPAASAESVVAKPVSAPDNSTPLSKEIDRWVDIKDLSFSARYRSEVASDDTAFITNAQTRSIVDGRLKLDTNSRYNLTFKVSSGKTFNWAYSDFINQDFKDIQSTPATFSHIPPAELKNLFDLVAAGYPIPYMPSRGWQLYPRQLYISATPVSWVTAEYGSLGIERGKSSEITTYDDDGYITGERLRLHVPKQLFFDEIAVTYAFEGDIIRPNFIDRTQHLRKSNYHQFLVSKNFTKRVGVSADYTFDKKTHTIRQAGYITLPEIKVFDALRAEFYQRLNTVSVGPLPFSGGSGFGLTAEKTLFARVKMDGGYEQVDPHYGATVDDVILAAFGFSMNGDSYSTGKHVFAHANIKLTPYASLSGFFIHQTVPIPAGEFAFAKQGFNGGLNIDLKKLVNAKQRVF